MGSERQTWRNLKKRLDETPGIHYQRFEDALSNGIPDLMVCHAGKTTFIELKHADTFPARAETPVRLDYRADQFAWAKRHAAAGGRVILLAQVSSHYYIFDEIYSMCNVHRARLNREDFVASSAHCKSVHEAINFILKGASYEQL